jgi:hypothetical protein
MKSLLKVDSSFLGELAFLLYVRDAILLYEVQDFGFKCYTRNLPEVIVFD